MPFGPLTAPLKLVITTIATVGLDALSFLLQPTPGNQVGARLDDRHVSSSAYGNSIPRGWGTIRTGGNIIWGPPIVETAHVQREGKKKHHFTVTTYTYSASVAVAFAAGTAKKFLKVWADGKVIYDVTGAAGPTQIPAVEYLRFYLGTETQNPDPLIQTDKGVGNTPAHRGMVYMVLTLQLADFGNRIPNFSAEITFDDVSTSCPFAGPVEGVVGNDGHFTDYLLVPGQLPFVILATSKSSPDSNRLFRVNSRTNLLEDSIDLPFVPSGNPVVDADGFLYTQETSGPAFNCRMDKIDSFTFKVVGTIGWQGGIGSHTPETDGYYSIQLNHRKCAFDTSDGRKLLALQGTFGQVAIIDRRKITTNDGSWPNSTPGAALPGAEDELDAIVFGAAANTGFGSAQGTIVGDKNGDVWVSSGAATLRHISGVDGSVVADYDVSAFMNEFSMMAYVAADHTLVIRGSDGKLHKLDCDTGGELSSYTLPTQRRVAPGDMWGGQAPDAMDSIVVAGNAQSHAAFTGPWFMRVPVLALADAEGYTDYGVQCFFEPEYSGSSGPSGAVYDPFSDSVWMTSHLASLGFEAAGLFRMYLDRAAGAGVSLATIVGDLCREAGLDDSQFDVTDLETTTVQGCLFDQQPSRDSIKLLAQAYLFDAGEHDGQLVFVRRLGAPVATIAEDELGAETDPNRQQPRLNETIVQETETPALVEIKFFDKDRDYQQGTQQNKRISLPRATVDAHGMLTLTLPIVLTADEAARIAQRILYDMWISRRQFKFSTGVRHARLDPTDVFQFTYKGETIEGRLTRTDAGAGCALDFQGLSHDGEIYTSLIAGAAGVGFQGGSLAQYDPTQLILLDIPLLRDVDANSEGSGLYFALGDFGGTWRGAVVMRSTDNATWVAVAGGNSASLWGRSTAALGGFSGVGGWDDKNTLTVRVVGSGAPVTDSELNVLNGANAAALLQADGTVEILQFVNATDNGDGTFTLSRLLRGQRGTEWAVAGHAAGEVFVMLSQALGRIKMDLSLRGVQEWYEAISIGQSSAPSEPLALQSNDLKPYAPAQLGGYLDASSNFIITWARRTRLGGSWQDGTGTVPLNEESELYDVEIYNSSGTLLKRTISGLTTPTAVYTVAQQTTDFGSPPAAVLVKAYQRSAAVGRGFKAQATVPTPGGWPTPFPATFASPASGQMFYVNAA